MCVRVVLIYMRECQCDCYVRVFVSMYLLISACVSVCILMCVCVCVCVCVRAFVCVQTGLYRCQVLNYLSLDGVYGYARC